MGGVGFLGEYVCDSIVEVKHKNVVGGKARIEG